MTLNWFLSDKTLKADGRLPYKVFQESYGGNFYARAGLELLGLFGSQLKALQACQAYEDVLGGKSK